MMQRLILIAVMCAFGIAGALHIPAAHAQGVMEFEAGASEQQPAEYYDNTYQGFEIEAEAQGEASDIESLDDSPAPAHWEKRTRDGSADIESGDQDVTQDDTDGPVDPFSLKAAESPADQAVQAKDNRAARVAPADSTVTLRGLDKITGHISEFTVPLGKPAQFGTLQINLRYCEKTPPEETPEVSAFLQIDELRRDTGEIERRFSGWMFASSPSISAMEHSIYDVWVIDCSTVAPSASFGKQ